MSRCVIFYITMVTLIVTSNSFAAIIVAASNSLPEEKAKADLICDGKDDQLELLASFTKARREKAMIDINPKTQAEVECFVKHAVQWLPGDYYISKTLEIPDAMDCVIQAEGTYFHYLPKKSDCILIRGANRCRYRFGTIDANTTDAAIRIQPTSKMPTLMSFIDFTGLIGHDQNGTGLWLDPLYENVCVNNFTGTDILGFDRGVFLGQPGNRKMSSHGKCDTNWFWFTYIRMCNTCVWESGDSKSGGRVDDSVWRLNVDASLPGAVAIRTAGLYGKWYVIMGAYSFEKENNVLILDPGAGHNVIEMHPPIESFLWEDNSGNDTNVILGTKRPPYKEISTSKEGT